MKNIYGGSNPIFESMSNSLKEDRDKGASKASVKGMDVVSAVSTALNTVFSILLNSKNESAKTPRGFEEIKNKILGATNFGSFRQYLVSLVESFGALDNAQRDAYEKNVKFIIDLLSGDTESTLSDPKIYDSLRKDIINKLLINFSNDLKERETQLRKTNPKLFGQVVKQGLVVKENENIDEKRKKDKKDGEETDVEDAEFRGAAFNKSKESLDASSGFVGMIDRDKYVPLLKDNEDVKRYKEIADGLYKKAQDMQMIDRKGVFGGKIVTASGEFKAKDYRRTQDDLLNEIIRQKKEYTRIKEGILKNNNVTIVPVVTPVCPPGKKYDESKGICVDIKKAENEKEEEEEEVKPKPKPKPKPVPVPTTECTFPVQLGKKCNEVGTIQSKLMEILPAAAEYMPKYGGADKKYGSATAKVVNIVWSYVSKNTLKIDGELTKDMYDTIMALTSDDVDKVCYKPKTYEGATGAKESLYWEMSIEDKIEEREEIKGSPILSFEDFYSVIEESYKFSKLDEQGVFAAIKNLSTETTPATGATVTNKKLIDCCVKDSILANTLVDCIGATGATGATGDIEWKGLKPVKDGTYTVFYDESWSDWWGDVAKGAVVSGIIIGIGVATAGTAIAIAAPGAVTAAGIGTGIGTAATVGAGGGALLWGGGIIGGAAVAKWAGNDRKPVSILVYNGYIEPVAVKGMARGLYNSMGGVISSQDMLAIYSTLILCRATFTDNGDGKAESVWEKMKQDYSSFDGDNLVSDINGITTSQGVSGFFKDIVTDMDDLPSFPPSFKTKDPNRDGGSITFEGAKDTCVDALQKLDKNSTKLRENLTHITEQDLELLSDSMGEITEQVEAKMSGEDSEDE